MKKKKRILVAGGAGFIGTHLCERLLNEGQQVICVDNFLTGHRQNLAHLLNHKHFSVVQHDITEPLNLEVEEIYNLACPASPVHYQARPVYTLMTCVTGAFHLLELARRTGSRLFQASTSEVYGDPQIHPQREDYLGSVNTTGPRACYDEGKRCAETLCFDYHRQYRVAIKVGRIFNTYGPHMQIDDGRVISNFVVQALLNRPLTIYGDGSQTRSFCYVDDLIDAILRFMRTEAAFPGPLNLGNPQEFTVLELAELVIRLTGSTSPLTYQPLPVDDPIRRRPDIGLARTRLDGWQPQVPLTAGLEKTIAYFARVLRDGTHPHPVGPAPEDFIRITSERLAQWPAPALPHIAGCLDHE